MKTMKRGSTAVAAARLMTWALALVSAGACGAKEDADGDAAGVGVVAEATEAPALERVTLDSAAAATIGLEVVEVGTVSESALSATGTVVYDQNRVSHVGPRAEGRVVRIERDLGDRVGLGAPLAVLESPDLGEAEAEHARTQSELRLAEENWRREQGLYEKGISSRKEMLEARTEYERARAALGAAEARHRTLGALDHTDDSIDVAGLYTVAAPLAGTVVKRNLVLGQIVGPEDDLFTVADLSRLWLILDIYDHDLSRVMEGLDVEVQARGYGDEAFRGTLSYVGQVVDSLTRTVKARVVVENPGHRLRPGMFATATIRGLSAGAAVAVPAAAVQRIDERTVVFVPDTRGGYRVRDVVTGGQAGDGLVLVLDGLQAGERVVSEGSFYLKSELLKDSFGGDEH